MFFDFQKNKNKKKEREKKEEREKVQSSRLKANNGVFYTAVAARNISNYKIATAVSAYTCAVKSYFFIVSPFQQIHAFSNLVVIA